MKLPAIKILVHSMDDLAIADNVELFVDGEKVDMLTAINLIATVNKSVQCGYAVLNKELTSERDERTELYKTL